MEKLKKLPIGIQTFSEISTGNYIYVDKTERIFQLVNDNKYYFLARPRRFGKSLLVSTLEAYFKGRKELFKGLAMERLEQEWEEHPVLRLDLSGTNYEAGEDLKARLRNHLSQWEAIYGKATEEENIDVRFGTIIKQAAEKTGKKVVLLVDEYDKPLIDTITNEKKQEEFRNILHGFYANIKASDEYIRFALLTGVSHFSKLTIFSGLNNLTDISLDKRYYDICGISESELEPNCKKYIERLAQSEEISYDDCLAKLKEYYDGYHFAAKTQGIYNPFSLINAFDKNEFGTYWMDSGTPTLLVDCLKSNPYYNFETLTRDSIDASKLADIRPADEDPRPLFYQTGYLTIKSYDSILSEYTLDFPNREVQESFLKFILPSYIKVVNNNYALTASAFIKDLFKRDIGTFMHRLQAFFASIPYDLTSKYTYEVHYQTVMYILFKLLGYYIHAEYKTSDGRIDLLFQTKTDTYIIELKVNGTSQEALQQINDKKYSLSFSLDGTKLTKIGVAFNKDKRTIEDWLIETE